MNREQAESLLAQLVFDDLEEPVRSQLLEYLKGDAELSEQLGDMRLTAKLLRDAVKKEESPTLDAQSRAGLWRRVEQEPKPKDVLARIGRYVPTRPVEVAACVAICAMIIGILLPALGSARRSAKSALALSNARQLSVGAFSYADDHDGQLPESVGQLVERGYVSPDLLIAPGEDKRVPDDFYGLTPEKQRKWADANTSFRYLAQGKKVDEMDEDQIVGYMVLSDGKDVSVARGDGSARKESVAEVREQIALNERERLPRIAGVASASTGDIFSGTVSADISDLPDQARVDMARRRALARNMTELQAGDGVAEAGPVDVSSLASVDQMLTGARGGGGYGGYAGGQADWFYARSPQEGAVVNESRLSSTGGTDIQLYAKVPQEVDFDSTNHLTDSWFELSDDGVRARIHQEQSGEIAAGRALALGVTVATEEQLRDGTAGKGVVASSSMVVNDALPAQSRVSGRDESLMAAGRMRASATPEFSDAPRFDLAGSLSNDVLHEEMDGPVLSEGRDLSVQHDRYGFEFQRGLAANSKEKAEVVPGTVNVNTASAQALAAARQEGAIRYPADWPQVTSERMAPERTAEVRSDQLGFISDLEPSVQVLTDDDELAGAVTLRVEAESADLLGRKKSVDGQVASEAPVDPQSLVQTLIEPDRPARKPKLMPVNPWVMTQADRLSTFALDVDTASYGIARRYILEGFLPPKHTVRMEEFVNRFDYNYPTGRDDRYAFTTHVEAGESPFSPGNVLMKIGVRGKVVGRDRALPAHLVFVVDTSGSMDREDRLPLVKQSLAMALGQLAPQDRVSLVTYGTGASLLVENGSAVEVQKLLAVIGNLGVGGSTNMLSGVALGYETAKRHYLAGGVNRVVLCSDGVANVGPSEATDLLEQAASYRAQGVTFTSVGFGSGSYDDHILEQLANRGDGGYHYVGTIEEARRMFVDDLAATRPTIAFDAKIQVDFDPARVRRYRLIGYENRDIADVDFRNDAIDAGDVGSGQSATALYELELNGPVFAGEDEPDIGTVYVRYRDADSGQVQELETRLTNRLVDHRDPQSDPRFYLAASSARFAEVLRGSEHVSRGDMETNLIAVEGVMQSVTQALPMDRQVAELRDLVTRARGLPRAE